MHLLVTAGVTQVPIDKVRVISSVFSGRTGTRIALAAHRRGHAVTLVTSFPQLVGEQLASRAAWQVHPFCTYDDLEKLLTQLVPSGQFDAIVHSAAVSDYRVADIYVPGSSPAEAEPGQEKLSWRHPLQKHPIAAEATEPTRGETAAQWLTTAVLGKLPSTYTEVWLRLVPTAKLIDRIRRDWGFSGVLVKFKLESGVSEETLLTRAEESRQRSAADLMVANLLESVATTAWLGPIEGQYRRLPRAQLADALLDAIENFLKRRH